MSAEDFAEYLYDEILCEAWAGIIQARDAAIRAQERQACADRWCKECADADKGKALALGFCPSCWEIKVIKGETP